MNDNICNRLVVELSKFLRKLQTPAADGTGSFERQIPFTLECQLEHATVILPLTHGDGRGGYGVGDKAVIRFLQLFGIIGGDLLLRYSCLSCRRVQFRMVCGPQIQGMETATILMRRLYCPG